ncbi:MAG: 16S rRNA (guanine(966)-N(2))-methyltransferase RsmD [Chromatiales bacterium]
MSAAARRPGGTRELRIIGGRLRGRRIRFPDLAGLRPTGDRVRETLFNWLQARVAGSRCLDLFAGSGALGLEAASRAAERVVLVERAPRAVRVLSEHARALGLDRVEVVQADALAWLDASPQPFDLVFLDPPFAAGLLGACCRRLEERGWLAEGALIYLETDARAGFPPLPAGWEMWREKRGGEVLYGLARRQAPA